MIDEVGAGPETGPENRAVHHHPLPPDGFDPSRADDAELLAHGLPAGPGFAAGAAAAFRRAFLAPPRDRPLRFVPAQRQALALAARTAPLRTSAAAGRMPVQKSANWSGASLAPRGGRHFVSVMGRWTVPTVTGPAGEAERRSSTWIGLDGQGFYQDSSLPQIGTLQIWHPGPPPQAVYETWYQWWARGQENAPEPLTLPVAAGDVVSAILTVLDPTTVRFNLKNETQGLMLQAFDAAAPGPCRISGATVAWIMERPSPLGSDGWHPYDLTAYAPFSFSECLAQSAGPAGGALQEHDLARARLIRMAAIGAAPTRVRTVSVPHRVPGQPREVRLTYVGP
ncbi:G1 family glutamic endopeptidase [Methylobacterium oryzisoli]|uniref:G1 family glutamic endopeptidase n=1 Tax=Methylobacterium oryzisoli TaxID=3385502 RepID=UPI003891A322